MAKTDDLELRWSARWSLTSRILAVNILALALLAGSFFWLDSYRVRLLDERARQTEIQVTLVSDALSLVAGEQRQQLAVEFGNRTRNRIRIYDPSGDLVLDSWALAPPTYENRDPATEVWQRSVARWMDIGIETIVWAEQLPDFSEPDIDSRSAWSIAENAARTGLSEIEVGLAPDRTPMMSAAMPLMDNSGAVVMLTGNARDIRGDVRDERLRLAVIIFVAAGLSVLLSLFLARTIVRPLRKLARSAQRVRLGRSREVVLPRLPSRRDEIGVLARALSDMSQALRQRIDATEAFAADVAHELKNPLASLHSAVDSLGRVDDPELQEQLLAVVRDDARRLDRLVTEISDASRVDAELSRANFEIVDVGELIGSLIASREERGRDKQVRVAFGRPRSGSAAVRGDGSRLARVIENLLDNAVSFSPDDGIVRIGATSSDDLIYIFVEDEGPGVPEHAREKIFHRFHSVRPESEDFGRHSGLGLAIAKTIIDAHDGTIWVEDRNDSATGARFCITLPRAKL